MNGKLDVTPHNL